jgi:hypothetical protein
MLAGFQDGSEGVGILLDSGKEIGFIFLVLRVIGWLKFRGFPAGEAFELSGAHEERQGFAGLKLVRAEEAQPLYGLVLEHEGLLGVAFGHLLNRLHLLRKPAAVDFLVPSLSAARPVPALGPAADSSGGAGRSLWGSRGGAVIGPAGGIERASGSQVAEQTKRRERTR